MASISDISGFAQQTFVSHKVQSLDDFEIAPAELEEARLDVRICSNVKKQGHNHQAQNQETPFDDREFRSISCMLLDCSAFEIFARSSGVSEGQVLAD